MLPITLSSSVMYSHTLHFEKEDKFFKNSTILELIIWGLKNMLLNGIDQWEKRWVKVQKSCGFVPLFEEVYDEERILAIFSVIV